MFSKKKEEVVDQEAEVTAPVRRERPKKYALYNEDGTRAMTELGAPAFGLSPCPNKPVKQPKAPKVIEYQKDENGEFLLDEAGEYIPVKKVRVPKLDADGNPIPKRSNVYLDSQLITLTEKVPNYRAGTKRGDIFASIKDGMTVGDFYELNGGKAVAHTFLVWYVNEDLTADVA